ncbi:MAG: acetyl-CoA hydrolase/transferase C-terminal domain-containing protein [Propionibacteriaceae bacterium]|nr:acetyl-CoA hydrolase/transferase C-terminal domain-containing protein [Propionibacteriaceae bacterium]
MDWKAHYRDHLTTAETAVQLIRSGDRVVTGHACGEPIVLTNAMVANAAAYRDVEIVHMVPMGPARYCAEGVEASFRHNSLFAGGSTRAAIAADRADFTPVFFHEVPELLRTALPVDVALIQVSPPDAHGYCSLGVSVDYTKAAAEHARTVIAQVNPQLPRTLGDAALHVNQIDCFVEADVPIIELPRPTIGEVEAAIGRHCASLVRDGDTLQLGIGAIPDAVLRELTDKHDLGVHSEMLSDGILDLIESGVVTNQRKTLHAGKSVVTFLMGSRRLYDFVDDNPAIHMAPVDYVNDPRVIAQNDNLVAINSCVQVDLIGQVVSSSVGLRQISGIGGQADFVRGASMSRGGRSIIAIASTASKGAVSKIVPLLEPGSTVSTGRCDVHYIVTEYGVAELWGQTLRERARRLIAIAHPTFRDELSTAFADRFPHASST